MKQVMIVMAVVCAVLLGLIANGQSVPPPKPLTPDEKINVMASKMAAQNKRILELEKKLEEAIIRIDELDGAMGGLLFSTPEDAAIVWFGDDDDKKCDAANGRINNGMMTWCVQGRLVGAIAAPRVVMDYGPPRPLPTQIHIEPAMPSWPDDGVERAIRDQTAQQRRSAARQAEALEDAARAAQDANMERWIREHQAPRP